MRLIFVSTVLVWKDLQGIEKDKIKDDFQKRVFLRFFFVCFFSFGIWKLLKCSPSLFFRTNATLMQSNSTGLYREISFNRTLEYISL